MSQQRAALEGVNLLLFAPQPGEIVATEHWCSSEFANTDLDLQLRRRGIQQRWQSGGRRSASHRVPSFA